MLMTAADVLWDMDCPACGGPVTLEVGPDRPSSTSLSDVVLDAAEDERLDVVRACWDCGWQEERRLRVEAVDTTAGDADAIERTRLLKEITDELAAIEALGTLEDTLAGVRRQRRLEPAAEDTNEDVTEEE
ncbi:hypothetical protein [Haloferax volcanii]|uniref:Small CPxCG-related zinc finger protein n=1 Tax=Haloferax volcanii JCM 10717 TaxID=1227458 RepID=M0IEQ0_HALVO|nr:hypothetical protein [Haloferax alexandrinus]ELZ94517.1 hypothetical protein C452_01755 [Haloferax alexandrinus JCM 10717]